METKPEPALSISRDELKALVQEAVRAALLDLKSDLKPVVREAVRELLQESNDATNTERDQKVNQILEAHLVRYRKVWEALA